MTKFSFIFLILKWIKLSWVNSYYELKENEFYPFLENNRNVLVFFIIKNCGYSIELSKKLSEIKSKFENNNFDNLPIRIYDCNNGNICNDLKIWSYPSFKYFVKKYNISENINIDYSRLYNFIKKRSNIKIYKLKDENSINNDLSNKKNIIIINKNKLNYEEIEEIKLISTLFNKFKIYNSNISDKIQIKRNKQIRKYNKDINYNNLYLFMRKLFRKGYFYLNSENMRKVIAYQKTSFVLFIDNDTQNKIISDFKNFSNSFIKSEFNFIISKWNDSYENKFLKRNAGILNNTLPVVFIMKYNSKDRKFIRYKLNQEINFKNLSVLHHDFIQNKLSVHRKIGPIKDLNLIKYIGVEIYDNKNLDFMIKYKLNFLFLIYDDLDENSESKEIFYSYKNFIQNLTKKIIKKHENQDIIFSLANINEYELDKYIYLNLPVLFFKIDKEFFILEYNENSLKSIKNYLLGDQDYLEVLKSLDTQ